ncbi:hypothetical protein [Mesorhizobium sp. M1252]|uniref:hypothetical protein n=1 Tax=Mesorhizobium sp. M1252 TaxID=2957073 RepID=UPI0033398E98
MEPGQINALEELRKLRDVVQSTVDRVKGVRLKPADRAEIETRKMLIREIERDLRKLEGG